MLDGKAVSNLWDVAMCTCYVCGSNPVDMNNLSFQCSDDCKINPERLSRCAPLLHFWIRSLVYMWHVGMRSDLRKPKWRMSSDSDKKASEKKRGRMQEEFKAEFGVPIDQVLGKSMGTSNTGNTARKVFENWEKSARIMNVNPELMRRLWVINQAVSCGYALSVERFKIHLGDLRTRCEGTWLVLHTCGDSCYVETWLAICTRIRPSLFVHV
eukprot:Lithocolla_globosa_v1_NODE_1386_length_2616_cov_35.702850.p2 type:complete len:212 gc:universal NODE_1386_length_2616_cov_35.702850:1061-1696(+)